MDLIYKIYSVYLYDHQLSHSYIILNNISKGYAGEKWDLPYSFSNTLNGIYAQRFSDCDQSDFSIKAMKEASIKNKLPFIKNDEFLTLVKRDNTHLSNYNIYDIYWNETKSGINVHEYEVMHIWEPCFSSYTSYRIWEHKGEREIQIRDNKLSLIL